LKPEGDLFFKRLSEIRVLMLPVEGVLTQDSVLLLENGEQLRQVSYTDMVGLEYASQQKLRIFLIQRGNYQSVYKAINIIANIAFVGSVDTKLFEMEKFILDHDIDSKETLFIGAQPDDLDCLNLAGVSIATNDASWEIKNAASYISKYDGGKGCVREIIEMILKSQDVWFTSITG